MEKTNDLQKMFYGIFLKLGGSSIEVELEPDDYNVAFDEALRTYRSHSTNSVDQGWYSLQALSGQAEYYLPAEIDNVIEIRRFRSGFFNAGGGYEPFAQAFVQQTLRGGSNAQFPGLLNFEAMSQYNELVERMFAANIMFEFDEGHSRLYLWTTVKADEILGLRVSALKSIDKLLKGSASYLWLQNYTSAGVKMILGEKYSKIANVPGPQGGTVLKGPDLKQKGQEEKDKLIEDLLNYADGGDSAAPFFG